MKRTSLCITALFFCFNQTVFSGIGLSIFKQDNNVPSEERKESEKQKDIHKKSTEKKELDDLKQQLLQWNNPNSLDNIVSMLEYSTAYDEEPIYKFSGNKVPIHFYTSKNDHTTVQVAGNIILMAEPYKESDWDESPYQQEKYSVSTELFLHGSNEKLYHLNLRCGQESNVRILAACFSVLGDVALIWEKFEYHKNIRFLGTFEKYIKIVSLRTIMKENSIDLNKNAIALKDTKNDPNEAFINYSKYDQIKSSLFSLDGTWLGICLIPPPEGPKSYLIPQDLIEYRPETKHKIKYHAINQKKSLSPDEKITLLEIIAFAKKFTNEKYKFGDYFRGKI